jgi:hypothetical protein
MAASSTIELVHIVFAVVVPDPHPLLGLLTQEIAPRRHRDAFDHFQAGLPRATGGDGAARGPALVVLPEQELPGRECGRIEGNERAQHEGGSETRLVSLFFAVSTLMRSPVARFPVGSLVRFFRPPDVPPRPIAHDGRPPALRKNGGPLGVKLHRQPNRDDAGRRVIILFEQVVVGGGNPLVYLPLLGCAVPFES